MGESREVIEAILESGESLEAAFLVTRSWDAVKAQLIQQLRDDLKEIIGPKGYEIEYPDKDIIAGNAQSGFSFRWLPEQPQGRKLRFEFDESGLRRFYWGMTCHWEPDQNQTEESRAIRGRIGDVISRYFGTGNSRSGATNPNWAWHRHTIDGWDMPGEFNDWGKSPDPWLAIQSGELAEHIVAIVDKVRSAFNDPSAEDLLTRP